MSFLIFHLGRNCYLKACLFFCKKELRAFNFFLGGGGGGISDTSTTKSKKGKARKFSSFEKKELLPVQLITDVSFSFLFLF